MMMTTMPHAEDNVDSALNAAIGYMVPEGVNVEQLVVGLYERVQREARCSDATLLQWEGEAPLAEGWGDLVISLHRVGDFEGWCIGRRDTEGAHWCIMHWGTLSEGDDGWAD